MNNEDIRYRVQSEFNLSNRERTAASGLESRRIVQGLLPFLFVQRRNTFNDHMPRTGLEALYNIALSNFASHPLRCLRDPRVRERSGVDAKREEPRTTGRGTSRRISDRDASEGKVSPARKKEEKGESNKRVVHRRVQQKSRPCSLARGWRSARNA